MDYLHYIVVVPFILLIIGCQISVFGKALHKIKVFKRIFPKSKYDYEVKKANIIVEGNSSEDTPDGDSDSIWRENHIDQDPLSDGIEVSQVSVNSNNETMNNIIDALNMYLIKNKGAVSDFALMKDVVERYTGAEEEEISVMQPIPLYMGLMGTMIGIIVGIGIIAFNKGVENLTNVSSMMTCVAIAMVASLLGIFFTTIISWKSKGAKTEIESNKNTFYSWLQTELLPVLSGNAVTALALLQSNLMSFNEAFEGNIEKFDDVLNNVRQVSDDQTEALKAISKIDINKVAQANIRVLTELQKCTPHLERFNKYVQSVNGYLDAVNALNTNINQHLERTAAIEKMGAFFEQEINQVQNREEYISKAVEKVDSTLEASFNQMTESMSNYFSELKSTTENDLNTVKEAFEQEQKAFSAKLKAQQEDLQKNTDDWEKVLQGIHSLSETKATLSSLTDQSRSCNSLLKQISAELQSLRTGDSNFVQKHGGSKSFVLTRGLDILLEVSAIVVVVLLVIDIFK